MRLRYILMCIIVLAIAAGAGIAHWATTPVRHSASCQAQIALPTISAVDREYFAGSAQLSVTETDLSIAEGLYANAARDAGIPPSQAAGEISVNQVPEKNYILATAADRDPDRAVKLANAACHRLVDSVSARRQADRATVAASLRQQIDNLQVQIDQIRPIPPNQRTVEQRVALRADQDAQARAGIQLASTLAGAPEVISVLAEGAQAARTDNRNLPRDLGIALVVGLLVCIGLVLFSEAVSRRGRVPI